MWLHAAAKISTAVGFTHVVQGKQGCCTPRYKKKPRRGGAFPLALAAFAAGLTCFLGVIGEVARVILLILLATLALLTLTAALLVLLILVPLLGSLAPFFGGALRIVCEIAGTPTLLVCHFFSPCYRPVLQTKSAEKGWLFPF
jgi:hypothetical protein